MRQELGRDCFWLFLIEALSAFINSNDFSLSYICYYNIPLEIT